MTWMTPSERAFVEALNTGGPRPKLCPDGMKHRRSGPNCPLCGWPGAHATTAVATLAIACTGAEDAPNRLFERTLAMPAFDEFIGGSMREGVE